MTDSKARLHPKCFCKQQDHIAGVQAALLSTVITCDGLSQLVVRFAQDADQTNDSARIDKRHLIFCVFIDEVPGGSSGISLDGSVFTGEKLNQSWDSLQNSDLSSRETVTWYVITDRGCLDQ